MPTPEAESQMDMHDVKVLLRKGSLRQLRRLDHDGSGFDVHAPPKDTSTVAIERGHPGAHAGEACANRSPCSAQARTSRLKVTRYLPSTTEDLRRR